MLIRVRFNVAVNAYAIYTVGLIYDVELTEELRQLIQAGIADHIPFPPSGTVP